MPRRVLVSIYVVPMLRNGTQKWVFSPVVKEAKSISFLALLNASEDGFTHYFIVPDLRGRTRWTLGLDDPGLNEGQKLIQLASFVNVTDAIHKHSKMCNHE